MKKTLTTTVLVLVTWAAALPFVQSQQQASPQQPSPQQPSPQQPSTQPSTGQQPSPAPQKKEIKDPNEYNAYVGAAQQTDPAAKISGLEAFLQQYPNSVMKEDALELLMGAYQQSAKADKATETAQRLLQVNPNNVRALALLSFYYRSLAQAGQDPQKNLDLARQYGEKGSQALASYQRPEGVSDANYEKAKQQMSYIFNAAVGLAALQAKDYATATKDLKAAAEVTPTDFSVVYPLALAYLSMNPADAVNGAWYGARAANLAPNPQMEQQIEKYVKSQYVKYHGSDQGWTELMASAKASPNPPAGFTITQYIPPTPAQQCADLVQKKAPKDMSFAEWELCLSSGEPADAEKVWSAIKGVSLQMEGKVISATPTKLEIAGSEDDIQAKRADIILNMTGPIPARLAPKESSTLDFEGTPASYQATPFVMTMDKGALLTKAAPPTRKPPARRRRPAGQ